MKSAGSWLLHENPGKLAPGSGANQSARRGFDQRGNRPMSARRNPGLQQPITCHVGQKRRRIVNCLTPAASTSRRKLLGNRQQYDDFGCFPPTTLRPAA